MKIDSKAHAEALREEVLSKPKLLTDVELEVVGLIGDPKYTGAYVEEWINHKVRPGTTMEDRLAAAGTLGFYSAVCSLINAVSSRRKRHPWRSRIVRFFLH